VTSAAAVGAAATFIDRPALSIRLFYRQGTAAAEVECKEETETFFSPF